MNRMNIAGTIAAALILSAGAVSAQTTAVTISTNAGTISPEPGESSVSLGKITITAPQAGASGNVSLSSLPILLSSSNGASISHLTNCRLENENDQVLTAVVNPSVNSNNFIFSSPILVTGGSLQELTLRCSVSENMPEGGMFSFTVASTAAGVATSTTPTLAMNLNVSPNARPGSQDTLLALVTLSARNSSNAIQISQIPLDVAFSNGATEGVISDCRMRNLSSLTIPLNTNNVGIVQGSNTITFDSPFIVPAGTAVSLALTCDVASTAPFGGIVSLSLPTNRVAATAVNSSIPVSVSIGMNANGQAGPSSGTITFSRGVATTTVITPGVPNTGSSSNMMLLGMSGLVAALGLFLARRMAR